MKKIVRLQQEYFYSRIGAFILFILLFTTSSFAQHKSESKPALSQLEKLDGFTQTYHYSKGQKTRSRDIAQLLEDAGRFYQKEINFTPKAEIFILAPHDWREYAAQPLKDVYGFPHNVDESRLVIAAEDNDFWRSFLTNKEQLPEPVKSEIKKAYSQTDGSYSMMPFFDLLALHELGHSYTAQAGLNMRRHWMSELFVNIMLHTYVAEKKPDLLPALEAFPDMVVSVGSSNYQYTSLADFEKLYATLGMGPQNYGWYQCKFHSAAKDIYNAGGKTVMEKLWVSLKKHPEGTSDEAFIEMLKKEVHPSVADVYLNWNKTD